MDDATTTTEERLRLDTLHDEELLRIRKAQEQERDHVAQLQAQTREHHKLMLDVQHQAIHDAALTRQTALYEQEYRHRERILRLERQYASAGSGTELRGPGPGFKDAGLGDEATVELGRGLMMASEDVESSTMAAVDDEEGFAAPRDAGSGRESSGENVPKKGSRAGYFMAMAKKAADRAMERQG